MTTFNPPYGANQDVATGIATYTDVNGNVVDVSEVEAYNASIQ